MVSREVGPILEAEVSDGVFATLFDQQPLQYTPRPLFEIRPNGKHPRLRCLVGRLRGPGISESASKGHVNLPSFSTIWLDGSNLDEGAICVPKRGPKSRKWIRGVRGAQSGKPALRTPSIMIR